MGGGGGGEGGAVVTCITLRVADQHGTDPIMCLGVHQCTALGFTNIVHGSRGC